MRTLLNVVTLPAKLTLSVASRVVGLVRSEDSAPVTVSDPPEPTYHRPSPERSHAGNGGAPPTAEAAARPTAEPAHVSEEPELVAEAAEPGAEDGAGAEVHVDEPWPGYNHMKAADIKDRLRVSPAAEAAAVSLYEAAGKGRSSVLQAASRRVKLSGPPSA